MPVKEFNKLVRDRIPYLVELSGRKVFSKVLTDEEFIKELHKKAQEEIIELEEAIKKDKIELITEELADVLLIHHTFKKLKINSLRLEKVVKKTQEKFNISKTKLNRVYKLKNKERGQFLKKIYLIEVVGSE